MRLYIKDLKRISEQKQDGFYQEFLSKGKLDGDYLNLDKQDFSELMNKYKGTLNIVPVPKQPKVTKQRISGSIPTDPITQHFIRTQQMHKEPGTVMAKNSGSIQGLGDLVAKFAQPVAKGIDAMFGTNVQGCGSCAKRQQKLNEIVPFN